MNSIQAGDATKEGKNGADYWLINYERLPDYYITSEKAQMLGWSSGDSPSKYFTDLMIGGDVYRNKNGHLPSAPGRIWYEADINYYFGKRNGRRIVYSNDGLIFVTYDHYVTFYESVIDGGKILKRKTIQRVIDFTGCKTWQKFEETIRVSMDFPDYYGRNADALWDLLREPRNEFVTFKGVTELPENLRSRFEAYLSLFEDNKKWQAHWNMYFDFKIES